jgi:hypothetical protein
MDLHRVLPLVLLAPVASALLSGCSGDGSGTDGREDEARLPSTSSERAAATVFDEFAGAVTKHDAAAACKYATTPQLPHDLRTGRPLGPVLVRDASGYDADLHLSARLINDPRGHLVLFFYRRDGGSRVNEALIGPYG